MRAHDVVANYPDHDAMNAYLGPVTDLRMDMLGPVGVVPYGDTTLAETKRRIGDRVCLVGGLNDMGVLERQGAKTVRRLGLACLEAVGTALGTYAEKAARNIMALVEVSAAFESA